MDLFDWIYALILIGYGLIIFVAFRSLPDTPKTKKLRYAAAGLALVACAAVLFQNHFA